MSNGMKVDRILVAVKTYPTLSFDHGENVCTAGLREDGSWIRLFPVSYQQIAEEHRYDVFDWIECKTIKNGTDSRPESFSIVGIQQLRRTGSVGVDNQWHERRSLVLDSRPVYDSIQELTPRPIDRKISLATFKPTKILDFEYVECDRDWESAKTSAVYSTINQMDLFESDDWKETYEIAKKLPYDFYYKFKDGDGVERRLMVLDDHVGSYYWECLAESDGDEAQALRKMRARYLDEYVTTDLHFFLGTTQRWHYVAPNPWVIVGVYPIPRKV